MIRKAFKTCAVGLAAGLGLLGGALPAMAQTPPSVAAGNPGDWPNLGAFNNRQGRNVYPFGFNAGQTLLRWESPDTAQERNDLIVDNTDLLANGLSRGGPYDDPQNSNSGASIVVRGTTLTNVFGALSYAREYPNEAAWPVPLMVDTNGTVQSTTADGSYVPAVHNAGATIYNTAVTAPANPNYNPRTVEYFDSTNPAPASQQADYNYAYGVPSDPAGDGTTASTGTAKYFEWNLAPLPDNGTVNANFGTGRPFALYASIPVGTSYVPSPTNPAVSVRLYPQRYFVYEIRFGPDRDGNGVPDYRIVDIVDTEGASSNGFVRLGMTGNEANTYFPSDGSTIRVRLYNTVPRDTMVPGLSTSTGRLLVTNPPVAGNLAAEVAAAQTHLVYADATRLQPQSGTFLASPTTATISGNTANSSVASTIGTNVTEDLTADWNVTGARTNYAFNFSYNTSDVSNAFTQDGANDGYTVRGSIIPGTDGVVTNYQANPALWTDPFTPLAKWKYSLAQNASSTVTMDNDAVSFTTGFTPQNTNPNHIGTTYLRASASTTGTDSVTYKPDLSDGTYDVYAYVPGNSTAPAEAYATTVQYEIFQGATLVYTGTLDESQAQGWVHLGGSRRFPSTQTALPQEALSVVLFNKVTATTDAGKFVYADALKFVGQSNSGFTSTPVHATVGIAQQGAPTNKVDTKVVLVADDNGRIHCLDEAGRGDGTTTEYWTYPTTIPTSSTSYVDPNLADGTDGTTNATNTPSATMPTGFNLSTAAIARITETDGTYHDFLYIGATNGRIYCIDMAGRGDYDPTARTPGTARRRWTFPDDYDPSTPSAPIAASHLGGFRGSLVFGYGTSDDAGTGANPTVYAGATNGQMIALDARGDQGTTRTTERWQFPVANHVPLPSIQMTPTLFTPTGTGTRDNRLMFGTTFDSTNEGPGQFYCLSARTGLPFWAYNDSTGTAPTGTNNPDTRVSNTALDSFVAGPVAADIATLSQRRSSINATAPAILYDTVYVLNQNGYLFGLNVADGTVVADDHGTKGSGTHPYITNILDAVTSQNLSFTFASDYVSGAQLNGTGANDLLQTLPMVVIPGANGVLEHMFARPEDYNGYTDLTDPTNPLYDYRSIESIFSSNGAVDTSDSLTSAAASNNFLFVNDIEGSLYALDNVGGTTNLPNGVNEGYTQGISPNNPIADSFRHLKVRLINRKGYNILKQVDTTTGTGVLTYNQTDARTDPTQPTSADLSKNYGTTSTSNGALSNPYAFEWGETAYVLVYNFPYATHHINTSSGAFDQGDSVPPPDVTVSITVEGRVLRAPTSLARQFASPLTSPTVGGAAADGYAVLAYAFNNSSSSALPPGSGLITTSIQTAALNTDPHATNALSVPQPRRTSTVYFVTANPLALTVADPTTGALSTATIGGGPSLLDGGAPENVVNGTPAVAGGTSGTTTYQPKPLESQLHAYAPMANHGTSTTARVFAYDRSLIVLLHEDGLSNFRVTRSNLQRQGGLAAVYKALSPLIYPGFEDIPTTDGLNTSLDYPDIGREQVRATLATNGSAQNPVAVSSTLLPPRMADGTAVTIDTYDQNGGRVPTPTPLDLTVDVPRYQPPVNVPAMAGYQVPPSAAVATLDTDRDLIDVRHDSFGNQIPVQGYFGRISAFIDSNNDNQLNVDQKETYRSLNMSTNVAPQYSVLTGTPTIDLGSLASGTGYAPGNPQQAYTANGYSSPFSPWVVTATDPLTGLPNDIRNIAGTGNWSDAYRSISIRNDSNVNLLDLRLAKAFNNGATVNSALPWALPSADNDPLAWMTGSLRGGAYPLVNTGGLLSVGDLWSNIDSTFAAVNRFNSGDNRVVLPKPRVTDRVPTELVADPYPRANPNLALNAAGAVVAKDTLGSHLVDGTAANRINLGVPASAPKVAVSVPLGFPVGSYSAQVRVVENIIPLTNPVDDDILQIISNTGGATNPNLSEVYSEPITLTYKVRESRLTNGPTARTATMIDSLVTDPSNSRNKIPTTYRNSDPTALRDLNGQLVVAWGSDRAAVSSSTAVTNVPNPSRIYLASAASGAGQNGSQAPAGNPPLWDLSQFAGASATQWFNPTTTGFPADGQINTLFPGGTPILPTVSFGSPSFPVRGVIDPLFNRNTVSNLPANFGTVNMAFVGDAQLQTGTGHISQSRVFMTTVNPGSSGSGAAFSGGIADMGGDPQTKKGKPSVLQLSTGSLVFFSETGAGQSSITESRLSSTGQPMPVPLSFGDGFSSVFSPSANARQYVGASNNVGTGAIVDLSFAGKLRGRPNAEVYLGRLRLNPSTGGLVDSAGTGIETRGAGTPFIVLSPQSNERAINEGNGVYRTRGVNWANTAATLKVEQWQNGTATNLLVGTGAVDRQSGLIAYDSRLGGKVYVDPSMGTVRFASSFPSRTAEIRVTYQPYFLRVTPGGTSGYSAVNGLFDDRYALDLDDNRNLAAPLYWFDTAAAVVSPGNAKATDNLRNDRYFFAYAKGAAGGGVTARPYTTSMRFGVRLPTRILTDNQGNVVGINVSGNTKPYQVDPANGRVYFMAEDEDRNVTISYTAVNEATNTTAGTITVTAPVSFVLERNETPLAVDEAANDSAVSAFVDPFTIANARPRPPLYWLFYVSTRAGEPDLYFQSIAPRFTPFAK